MPTKPTEMANLPQHPEALAALQTIHVQQLLESACNQQSGDIIKQVRGNADIKYKLIKQEKQKELSCRVDTAKGISKIAFKNAKKKVDNHASSVASRSRRIYLISSYETIVKKKMQESARLAELLQRQVAIEAKKDADIRRMQLKIQDLTRELDAMKSKMSTTQSSLPSSCNSHPQDNAWQEFSMHSIPYHTVTPTAPAPRYVQSDVGAFNPLLDRTHLPEEAFEDTEEETSELTTYLDGDPLSAPAEGLQSVEDCLKMASRDWRSIPIPKDAQAQIRADTPSDVLHPAV